MNEKTYDSENKSDSGNKYTAIIIEPRRHKALEFVLENFLTNLSDEWSIIIYYGLDNKYYLRNIIRTKLINFINRISTVNLNVKNLTIDDYNNLMINRDFVNSIPTEVFLIFQTDTLICEETKYLLDDFMKYDYVGAPWIHNGVVGNGGLSLRRKSKMLEIIDNCEYLGINEDEYFSWGCKNVSINLPTVEEAKKFSIETMYNRKSFGIHKAWVYLKENINNQCKNYDKLVRLNIEKFVNTEYINKNEQERYILMIIIICIIIYYIYKSKIIK